MCGAWGLIIDPAFVTITVHFIYSALGPALISKSAICDKNDSFLSWKQSEFYSKYETWANEISPSQSFISSGSGILHLILADMAKLKRTNKNNIPIHSPAVGILAGISGLTGGVFGNSSDMCNIRMQNDGSLPPHLRRSYRHIFDAWIKRQERWNVFGQKLWPNTFAVVWWLAVSLHHMVVLGMQQWQPLGFMTINMYSAGLWMTGYFPRRSTLDQNIKNGESIWTSKPWAAVWQFPKTVDLGYGSFVF